MNRVEELAKKVKERLPSAELSLDRPKKPNGAWWMDVRLGKTTIVVEWRPAIGFGISSVPSDGYGEGADEIYDDAGDALQRIVHLLKTGARTQPPSKEALKSLRERRGVSQVELAEMMGVRQATISKMENREDLNLSTLRRIIKALGGVLEVNARFPDRTVSIEVGPGDDPKPD